MVGLDRLAIGGEGASPLRLGAVGLALGSAAGSWLEFGALWRRLRVLEPSLRMPWSDLARSLLLAVVSAALGWLVGWLLPAGTPVAVEAAAVLGLFGLTYVGGALAWGVPEAEGIRRRLHLRRR
jgi:putative peptidoglycan lipid II flippase